MPKREREKEREKGKGKGKERERERERQRERERKRAQIAYPVQSMRQYYFDRPGRDHIQHWNALDELEDSSEFDIMDPPGRDHIQHWSVAAEHVQGNPATESQFYNTPATGGFEEHVGGALRSMCRREGGASEHAQQTVM